MLGPPIVDSVSLLHYCRRLQDGRTAVSFAAQAGYTKIVRHLIAAGAAVGAENKVCLRIELSACLAPLDGAYVRLIFSGHYHCNLD